MKSTYLFKALMAATLAALIAACASTPKPVALKAEAQTTIEQALKSDAREYALAEITAAEKYFKSAEQHIQDEEFLKAERALEKASASAELAYMKSQAGKAQEAAKQIENDLIRLQNEGQNDL